MAVISIIIPNFNSETTILETLKSLKKQSFPEFECIIVDDCSTDKSFSLVSSFIFDDARFSVVQLSENKGASACRNIGIENSIANYIMFLDSDDLLSPYCLEQRMSLIQVEKHFTVFPNYINVTSSKTKEIIKNPKDFHQSSVLKDFIVHTLPLPWNISGVIWKKNVLSELKGFDISYFRMQDVELMTRALLMEYTYEIHFLKPDFIYRATELSHSIKNKRLKFYNASLHYMCNILSFANVHSHERLCEVRGYMRKFMFHILVMTLLSNQFSVKDSKKLLHRGSTLDLLTDKQELFIRGFISNRWVRSLIKLPIIRGLVWRSLMVYLKRN